MTRLLLFFAISLGLSLSPLSHAGVAGDRPNILFIAVDDLRPELGLYGVPQIQSPNIDRLGAEGAYFTAAYCNAPQCGPSRASVMTGLRPGPDRFFTRDGLAPTGYVAMEVPEIPTLPGLLRAAGYETVVLGKVYHHFEDDPGGWSKPAWKVGGNNRWHDIAENFQSPAGRSSLKLNGKGKPACLPWESADVPDNAYPDGLMADRAIEELNALSAKDAPFFLALGFLRPHLPLCAPQKYWDLYPEESIRLPGFMRLPDGAPEEAAYDWPELRSYIGIPKKGPLSEDQARTLIRAYYACVSYVDAQIGRVLAALESNGLSENTLVVLWGDHGWNLGEHGLWCKHTTFETSLRVPLVLRGPGVAPGSRTSFAELIDLYPTLLEFAGVDVPVHNEGISLWPQLRDPASPEREFSQSYWKRAYSVKNASHRLTYWPHSEAAMLFDHTSDPDETVNRIDDPGHQAARSELMRQLPARN